MSALFFIFEPVKTTWVYKAVKFLKKVYFRNDKRVAAYLVCVAIATGFWFLNALSKVYTVDMVVPVSYVNFPTNKTLSNRPPDRFDLKVKAHGFTILRHRLSFLFMPFEFNVNDMTNNRMTESRRNNYAFPARQFLTELSYQLSNDMEILNMSPDTLYFSFDKMGQRRVKVMPKVKVNLKKQYQISGDIETTPDSVTINGPQTLIDTLKYIYAESPKLSEIDKGVTTQADLKKINEVYYDHGNVELKIPVEEYTEAQLSVPVSLSGQPSDLNIKLFPAKVKVSFQVGLSRFSEIKPEDFKLFVSYADIQAGKQKLTVSCESSPAYLYAIKITPEQLEYLIENK